MTGDRPLPGLRRLADLTDEQLLDLLAEAFTGAVCTGCGCTDAVACPEQCWWVAPGWCSACERRPLRRLRRWCGRRVDQVLDAVEWPAQQGRRRIPHAAGVPRTVRGRRRTGTASPPAG